MTSFKARVSRKRLIVAIIIALIVGGCIGASLGSFATTLALQPH